VIVSVRGWEVKGRDVSNDLLIVGNWLCREVYLGDKWM